MAGNPLITFHSANSGRGLRRSACVACAAEDRADADEEAEVVPAADVADLVDRDLGVKETDDEGRCGEDALE